MTSFNINCLQFGTNYTIGVAPINKCDKLVTSYQYVSCKPIASNTITKVTYINIVYRCILYWFYCWFSYWRTICSNMYCNNCSDIFLLDNKK